MIGLQTTLSLALQTGLDINLIVEKLAVNPRRILNIDVPSIAEGQVANLVLFDADAEWEYTKNNNRSKSYNSPFIGQGLKGKVLLTLNNNHLYK
jgi:dihydroorotase